MRKIKFLGASGTVTGSCYLLSRTDDPGLLIDMGMFQGPKETTKLNYQELQFNPQNLEAVILTHAHLDHSGRLPILAKHGFNKPIFMTKPTKDLIEIALLDAAHIAEHDAEVTPMYAEEDVLDLLTNAEIVSYERTQELLHILDHLKQENNIRRDTPVYLDSPMASRVTKVYKIYREYYGDELAE